MKGLGTSNNLGLAEESDVLYPVMGSVADRDEFQRLLERCFESSRRRREDQEYEEWLSDLRSEGRESVSDVDEDEQRIRDL